MAGIINVSDAKIDKEVGKVSKVGIDSKDDLKIW
jgi:hypothetical protein